MANHDVTNPTYHSELRKYETTYRGHADVFNANENVLINNDVYLKKEIDTIKTNNASSSTKLDTHTKDTTAHITATERQTWNNKASTSLATTTQNGLMSAADKQAINNLSTTISSSVTGQKVLTEIKKVDGTGSGLDADLLDGKEASAFALSNHAHNNATASQNGFMSAQQAKDLEDVKSATSSSNLTSTINETVTSTNTINKILTEIKKVDGTGSGLDADLLDGKEASAFALSNHTHSNATTTANGLMSKEDKSKLDGIGSSLSTCTNIKNGEGEYSIKMNRCDINNGSKYMASISLGIDSKTSSYDNIIGLFKPYNPTITHDDYYNYTCKTRTFKYTSTIYSGTNDKISEFVGKDVTISDFATEQKTTVVSYDKNTNILTISNDFGFDFYAYSSGNCCICIRDDTLSNSSDGLNMAIGDRCEAYTEYDIAIGKGCTANNNSVSIGYYGKAVGNSSFALGGSAIGDNSLSIGVGSYNSVSSGEYSTSIGSEFAVASGSHSFVQGYYTIAKADYSIAMGKANKNISDNDLFIIGNGDVTWDNYGKSTITRSNAFRVTNSGIVYSQGAYNTSGADYAEYFEWPDQNPNNEDRVGLFVTLDEDKIRLANSSDDYILGVVSATPVVLGNSFNDQWKGMYLKDEFERIIYEEVDMPDKYRIRKNPKTNEEERILISKAHKETRPKINPDFNPDEEFIGREKRSEWSPIGMLGVLSVYDDGTCKSNGYCKVADGGIATASETGYRVLKRVNDKIVKILFR